MLNSGVDAVVIPSSDPHSSEYVHPRWKFRGWISGFNGSAGTVVITKDKAGLWTDFRYYIEAEEKLSGTGIDLYRQGLKDVPTITEYLKENIKLGGVLGIDGTLFSTATFEEYEKELKDNEITIKRDFDPTLIWKDRPESPLSKAYGFDVKFCGESREDKISRVRNIMKDKGVDNYIISSLDDIAWLFNIRGRDVDFTPLIMSYAIVTEKKVFLFIDNRKIDGDLKFELSSSGITILEYNSIADYILSFKDDSTVYYMPQSLNSYLSGLIPPECNVKRGVDITTDLKAIKNSTEIENIRSAMEKDGAALVKFFKFLDENKDKENFTEYSLAPALKECRLSMPGCVDESFGPIIGYRSNGALCHYSAQEDSAKNIGNSGLLLIDSGGQYYEGTTDITRTISMGNPTIEETLHYTLVLKGHIKLSMAKYPEGTTGAQLDILARQPLWDNGLDFGHGTGHGVGFFLGVHEGPQSISTKSTKAELKEGMVTSNEPGIYIEGKHGIRIENLILTKCADSNGDKKFLEFETLTLYPYDVNLIDKSLLTGKEIEWLNSYHREVIGRIKKYLNKDELEWLKGKAVEI